MFSRPKEPSSLELATDEAIRVLRNQNIGSEEYAKTLEIVTKLHKMKTEEASSPMSKDTMLTVGANLLGIFMIIKHEYVNVITSRAMNLVMRTR